MSRQRYLRPDQAAWELQVSKRTIYRLIECGALVAFSIRRGGAVRIPAESLERFIEDRKAEYREENGIFVTGDDTGCHQD